MHFVLSLGQESWLIFTGSPGSELLAHRLQSRYVPGRSRHFHTVLGEDLLPAHSPGCRQDSQLCERLAQGPGPCLAVSQEATLRVPPSVSCHLGLSMGQLTPWQNEPARKQHDSPGFLVTSPQK